MFKFSFQFVLFISLFLFVISLKAKGESSIPLVDSEGVVINQISSMAKLDHTVILISQEQHNLFFAPISKLDNALNKSAKLFRLNSVKLAGDLPKVASWEAITIGSIDNVQHIFLSHEHSGIDTQGNFHQVFYARITFDPNSNTLVVGQISAFSPRLPIAELGISEKRATNFGYEALVWLPEVSELMVIPELSNMETFVLNRRGEIQQSVKFEHGFRITDATSLLSERCFAITSFCYKADPICTTSQGKSVLSVATLSYTNNRFDINKQFDVSNQHGFTTFTDNAGDKIGLYNAEGLVEFGNKFYMVNDNRPGNVKTVLKRIEAERVQNLGCNE